jgi:hypothetical protein
LRRDHLFADQREAARIGLVGRPAAAGWRFSTNRSGSKEYTTMIPSLARTLACSILIAVPVVTSASDAFAQSPAAGYVPPPGYAPAPVLTAAPPPKENSINISPLGVVFGGYSLNYEHLWDGMHGVVVEGEFSHASGTSTESSNSVSASSTSYGGAAGYRWHWSGRQDSGFLGLMAGYDVGTGSGTVTRGGTAKSIDLTLKASRFVANIGKRWQWDSGFNITFRIGAGWAKYEVSSNSSDPQAQDAVKGLQNVLTLIPIAFDGELSIGYSF